MSTEATQRRPRAVRRAANTLDEAIRRAPRRSTPVVLNLASGALSVDEDEVLVVVVGGGGALVSRTHVRGRPIGVREMCLRLAGAEAAVEEIASSPPAVSTSLTAAEASLLDDAGLAEEPSDSVSALERSRIELEVMLRESLSLEDAAAALGVGTSRLRQRLSSAERSLYGIKEGRGWRIPKFQFRKGALVRGIDKVFPHVRPDAHPIAVKSWFTSPHQDLVVGDDERPVSPIAWLSAGRSAEEVAGLAHEI